MSMKKPLTFKATQVRETQRAVLVRARMIEPDPIGPGFVEFERTVWLPKSQVEIDGDTYTVPRWLARDRGLECGECRGMMRYQVAV